MMRTVNKDMTIAGILAIDRGIAEVLLKAGMHCVGCPSAQSETLEEACSGHGIDADGLVNDINAFLAE